MLIRNANLPEIEQLERYEFDLDVEEQTRLQQEAKEAVLQVSILAKLSLCIIYIYLSFPTLSKYILFSIVQVYERIEQENLTKLYLKDIIKKQCFDTMKVKGRTLMVRL